MAVNTVISIVINGNFRTATVNMGRKTTVRTNKTQGVIKCIDIRAFYLPVSVTARIAHSMRIITLFAIPFLIASRCGTTAGVRDAEEPEDERVESSLDKILLDSIDFDRYCSRLSDHYANVDNEIPEVFKINEMIVKIRRKFRLQNSADLNKRSSASRFACPSVRHVGRYGRGGP